MMAGFRPNSEQADFKPKADLVGFSDRKLRHFSIMAGFRPYSTMRTSVLFKTFIMF